MSDCGVVDDEGGDVDAAASDLAAASTAPPTSFLTEPTQHGSDAPQASPAVASTAPPPVRRVGDARVALDGVEYRCCETTGTRSALMIARDGTLRRLYGDTGRWTSPQAPRLHDEDGSLRCGRNMRLERALARAWLGDDGGVGASLARPEEGLMADNVVYRGRRRQPTRPPGLSACEGRALAAATRGEGVRGIHDVARACEITTATAWTYLARAACSARATDDDLAHLLEALVDPALLAAMRAAADADPAALDGGLRDVRVRVAAHHPGGAAAVDLTDDAFAQLRLARACLARMRDQSATEDLGNAMSHAHDNAMTHTSVDPVA